MWLQEQRWKNWAVSMMVLLGFLLLLAACGGAEGPLPDAEEATSVEEQAEEEAVEIEVTRVVEEIITEEEVIEEEEMEEEMEEPAAEESLDPPEAIGSEDDEGSPFEPEEGPKVSSTREAGNGWVDESVDAADPEDDDETAVAQVNSTPTPTVTPAAPTDTNDDTDNTVRAGEEPLVELAAASQLTAGEVDDNSAWATYLEYLNGFQSSNVIPVSVSRRQVIQVVDMDGRPVLGANVMIEPTERVTASVLLQTTSSGVALFFPDAYEQTAGAAAFNLTVQHMGVPVSQSFNIVNSEPVLTVTWPATVAAGQPTAVDILFLIDTTGSMGDELQQLKDNILFIAQVVEGLPSQPDVRFGMTVYRDRGEAFISRTFDFTADVTYFAEELATVEAHGGGDYPEDLNEGLQKALTVPSWREDETVKLIFLVADAPPHIDYDDVEAYPDLMVQAAAQGIKIYPISSSGLDRDGEYIFRQLAQFTGAKFLFLTYGAAGAGSQGENTDLAVSESGIDYDVTSLDGLVIKIVEEELAHRPVE